MYLNFQNIFTKEVLLITTSLSFSPPKESSRNQKQLFYIEGAMKSSRKQNKNLCQFEFQTALSAHSGSLVNVLHSVLHPFSLLY